MGRAPCCDKANVKKGPWSPEEDAKLKDYIEKFGTGGNWIALPQKAGLKRCGKSCRLRWLNYLRPNIKHGEFSDEEDRIICSLYANIGSRWSIIAAQLPGRTDNDIKNYWNTKLKKKLMMGTMINNNNNSIVTPNNNTIINPKKTLLNHHQYHHSMLQYNQYPSSLSSPSSLLSHVLSPSPSSPYQCTSTHYNNSNLSSMTMSFTQGCYNNNNNTDNNTLILMQNQQEVKDNSTLLVFGDHQVQHQPSSCSSDGSCSVSHQMTNLNNNNPVLVKVEDQQKYGDFNNGVQLNHHHQEEDERRSDHDHAAAAAAAALSDHDIELLVDQKHSIVGGDNAGLWGQNAQTASDSLLDYGLEEIKQLISTNYFDDTKPEEKDTKKRGKVCSAIDF